MQITRKTCSIILKIFIACLAGIGAWSEFNTWGTQAWRLFDTYIMLAVTIYYFMSAGFLFFNRRQVNETVMPGFAALLVLNCLLILISAAAFGLSDTTFPTADGFSSAIICGVVPILVLVDWLFFCQKGRLRLIDPFYWLAPVVIYACLIVTTASMMPNMVILRLPYEMMNYYEIGIDMMVLWGLVILALMLIAGYIIYCLDFTLSGNLSKHIVMPKLKPVVVDLPKSAPLTKSLAPAITLVSSTAAVKSANKVPAPQPIVTTITKKSDKKPPVAKQKTATRTPTKDDHNSTHTNKTDNINNVKNTKKADSINNKSAKFHKPATIQNAPSNSKKPSIKTPITQDTASAPEKKTAGPGLSRSSEFHVPKTVTKSPKTVKNESKQPTTAQNPKQVKKEREQKIYAQKDEFKLPSFSSRQDADAPRPSKSLKPVEAIKELAEKPLESPKPIKLAKKPQSTPKTKPVTENNSKPRPKIAKF